MYHKTEVIGHLGNDAEINEAGNGNTVINFNVAATDTWKDKQSGKKKSKTTWYRCEYWTNNTAISPYLIKGTLVRVEGRSKANAYTNREGELVVQEGVNVFRVQLLSGSNSKPNNITKEDFKPKEDDLPFGNEPEDDLGF